MSMVATERLGRVTGWVGASGQKSAIGGQAIWQAATRVHVLPQAFTRIRHFGLCAGRNVRTKLQTARTVLTALTPTAAPQPPASTASEKDGRPWWQRLLDRTGIDILVCPSCGRGRLVRCGDVQPLDSSAPDGPLAWLRPNDTS